MTARSSVYCSAPCLLQYELQALLLNVNIAAVHLSTPTITYSLHSCQAFSNDDCIDAWLVHFRTHMDARVDVSVFVLANVSAWSTRQSFYHIIQNNSY